MLNYQLTMPDRTEEAAMDVTAMVGLAGQLCGVMSVRCSHKAAVLMASKMLAVELEKAGPDMPDALGEVCNMVAGNFKNKIPGVAETVHALPADGNHRKRLQSALPRRLSPP
jgi:chemotaxis protein CheX